MRTDDKKQLDQLWPTLGSKEWRMNNLFSVKNKEGKRVRFRMNRQQRYLLKHKHNKNLILKARQLGMTTFWCIYDLDEALFIPNQTVGIIAHSLKDVARIEEDKIKFTYDCFCEDFKLLVTQVPGQFGLKKNEGGWRIFNNGSAIYVANSMRSASITQLHVSEFGKICAQEPAKAEEIVTGALNAVGRDQLVTIESTAEGQRGYFYEYAIKALDKQERGQALTSMDYKFFFFPWWDGDDCLMDPSESLLVELSDEMKDYFERLAADHDIKLSHQRKAWYVKKSEEMVSEGKDPYRMRREFPSFAREAFEQTIDGAYYEKQFQFLNINDRITTVPHHAGRPVHTFWDIGVSDYTCIWFVQERGEGYNVIDYLQKDGEGLPYYVQALKDRASKKGYTYGTHVAPHDIAVRDWSMDSGKTRREVAMDFGIHFDVAAQAPIEEGIEKVRQLLPQCWFDQGACELGLKALRAYRKKWDDKQEHYRDRPEHNWASHGADAFRTFAMTVSMIRSIRGNEPAPRSVSARAWS